MGVSIIGVVKNLIIRIGGDFSELSKEMNKAGKFMKNAGKDLQKIGKNLTTAVTLPVVGIGTAAVKVGMDFEAAMSEVAAISGATGKDLELLENKAKEMGKATSKSATESANALSYMALAGWDAKTSAEALEPVLRLSEAGNLDLALASDLVTDSMSALGLTTKELPMYLDQMAKTSSKSNTSVQQLGEAMVIAGGTFKNLNVPMDEANAILGIMANRGLKGSEAANSLNSVMINLTTGAGQAGKAMKELGINAFDSEGKFKGMGNVLKEVKDKTKNMTEEQRNLYLSMIGGKTQLTALQALLDGVGNEFDTLQKDVKNSEGALGDMAATMQDNLKGAITRLKSGLEGLGIQISEMLIPYLNIFAEKIQSVVDWLSSLDKETQSNIIKFALLAAAIGPVILVIGKMTSTISAILLWSKGVAGALAAVQAGTAGVGAIFTAVFGPAGIVLLVLAGIAALIAGLIHLWKNNEDFRNKVLGIWENIKNVIGGVTKAIKEFFKGNLEKGLESLYETFIDILGEKITNEVVKFAAKIVPIISNACKNIKDTMITVFSYIWNTLKPIIEGIKNLISAMFDFVIAALKVFVGLLKGIWTAAFNALKPIVELAFNAIKFFWDTWGSNIVATFKNIWDTVTSVFKGVIKIITGLFQTFTGLLTGNWSKTWQGIKNIFVGIWDSMKAVLKGGINFFINGINSMINGVNKVKIPDFVPGIGGKGFNIPRIPMLASGGVITKPTLAMVGEGREDEAVLPLSKLNSMLNLSKEDKQVVQTFPKDINIKLTMPNGKVLAEITAPFLDTIQGKNIVLAGRGVGI